VTSLLLVLLVAEVLYSAPVLKTRYKRKGREPALVPSRAQRYLVTNKSKVNHGVVGSNPCAVM